MDASAAAWPFVYLDYQTLCVEKIGTFFLSCANLCKYVKFYLEAGSAHRQESCSGWDSSQLSLIVYN